MVLRYEGNDLPKGYQESSDQHRHYLTQVLQKYWELNITKLGSKLEEEMGTMRWLIAFVSARVRSTREGTVFTGVC